MPPGYHTQQPQAHHFYLACTMLPKDVSTLEVFLATTIVFSFYGTWCNPVGSFRSSNTCMLQVPKSSKSWGDGSFSHAGPTLWNDLPLQIRNISSLDTFKIKLKPHCLMSHMCNWSICLIFLAVCGSPSCAPWAPHFGWFCRPINIFYYYYYYLLLLSKLMSWIVLYSVSVRHCLSNVDFCLAWANSWEMSTD